MKQVIQNLRSGAIELQDVPSPALSASGVRIQTVASLISPGTERSVLEFSRASLIGKARSQPERIRQVLDKVRADGIIPTIQSVFARLDEPLPMGYCNSGVVMEVGAGVTDLAPGDLVASNGSHAQIVCVPRNLCAKLPAGVSHDQAIFTMLGATALQGIRLLNVEPGQRIVVFGLGLIGLLAVQILKAMGADVLGVDVNRDRMTLAEKFGVRVAAAGGVVQAADDWTGGAGADGVLITASGKTDQIIHDSAAVLRRYGKIVLVGAIGLNIRRADFYKKELTFQVSCSYGPGRYDDKYESATSEQPVDGVGWTLRQNVEKVLALMQAGQVKADLLISARFAFDSAPAAYEKLSADPSCIGIVLDYSATPDAASRVEVSAAAASTSGVAGKPVVAVIGAGNFTRVVLLPALAKTGVQIAYIADRTGVMSSHLARKYGAAAAVTDYQKILDDARVNAVLIATRHDSHASLARRALQAGKSVFVEKPPALDRSQLDQLMSAVAVAGPGRFMVGYNRRFSRFVVKMKELLVGRTSPLTMSMTVNAGAIPASHWVHDSAIGGGRIIGEGCHFIDFMLHLTDAKVASVQAAMTSETGQSLGDKMSITMQFTDGSLGVLNYFANGHRGYPKERLEVFSQGRTLLLDNFRTLCGWGWDGFSRMGWWGQDKGHAAELAAFVGSLATGRTLIAADQIANVSLATFAAVESAKTGRKIEISSPQCG